MQKIIILISLLFLSTGCGSGINAGEGKKIGRIVKIGEHGMICPTYEAEIIRGGFSDGSGVNGISLDFSIKDIKLYDELVVAMENQEEIELSYTKQNFSGFCYSETGTIATGFRVLNTNNPKQSNNEIKTEQN